MVEVGGLFLSSAAVLAPAAMVVGVDEAGRGPLAGPVVAAAVILGPHFDVTGINDSKKLSATQRETLALHIRQSAHAWAIAQASVEEIDQLNILQATMLAMQRAVLALPEAITQVWVDGNRCPSLPYPSRALIQGDALRADIGAASILAKTTRDAHMLVLDQRYPGYGLAQHKGYPTAQHRRALQALGVTPIHRRSYGPVQMALALDEPTAPEA